MSEQVNDAAQLEYTDEIAREMAPVYERVKDVIPAIEWPFLRR